MKTSLFLSTAIGALLVTGVAAAAADPITFVPDPTITDGVLSEENEVPAVTDVTTTANAKFTYYPDTKKLCGSITFIPATPPFEYTGAHIHKGSKTTASGDLLIALASDNGAGEIKVTGIDLTAEQATALTTGETYVNVHTEAHAGGAMRNQLVQDDKETPVVCEGGDEPDGGTGTGTSSSSSGATSGGDGGKVSSSTSGSVTPNSTDDGGGCNTTGSNNTDALAALLGLGVVITAAARKRKKA